MTPTSSTPAAFGPSTGIGDQAVTGTDGRLTALQLGRNTRGPRNVDGTALDDLPSLAFDRLTRRLEDADVTVVGVASRTGSRSPTITGDLATDLAEPDVLAADPAHPPGEYVDPTDREDLAGLVHRLVTRLAEERPTLTQGTTG